MDAQSKVHLMSHYSLAESPSGLVHIVQMISATSYSPERAVTSCGRDVDFERWLRIRMYDTVMFGKGPSAIAKLVELPKCDRCFGS